MAKTYKKKRKGGGHLTLTNKMLSSLFSEHIPELINEMTESNREMFTNLDKEFYIRDFLTVHGLTMSESNIKNYAKKSKTHIDRLLNYLNSQNELKKRKEKAQAKIKIYNTVIKLKQQELKKIMPQRVTRSQKNNPPNNNQKIEKLENEIKNLENNVSTLNYRIQKQFRGLSPRQDDYI